MHPWRRGAFNRRMGEQRRASGRDWRRLWRIPRMARDMRPAEDWDRLEINAIGSMWGRGDVRR
ncbi:hypothetical protein GCM10023114_37200 [Mycolicibacterium sediminis]|uniref:Uncharacterized protein n=2 Tax=Mycolicibacterium sediminis TaxID=1286180 RepID=A0A7I7QWP4_9MYCO|nr:hypothetical protein MSEDJ_47710 [Mycolicibacterium sediminis]